MIKSARARGRHASGPVKGRSRNSQKVGARSAIATGVQGTPSLLRRDTRRHAGGDGQCTAEGQTAGQEEFLCVWDMGGPNRRRAFWGLRRSASMRTHASRLQSHGSYIRSESPFIWLICRKRNEGETPGAPRVRAGRCAGLWETLAI